jgi:hypothetical protein
MNFWRICTDLDVFRIDAADGGRLCATRQSFTLNVKAAEQSTPCFESVGR